MADDYKTHKCMNCGYTYDEAAGDPDLDVAPGTRWADLPADWLCPQCGSDKRDFEVLA